MAFALQPLTIWSEQTHTHGVSVASLQWYQPQRVSGWMFWLLYREHSGFLKLGGCGEDVADV